MALINGEIKTFSVPGLLMTYALDVLTGDWVNGAGLQLAAIYFPPGIAGSVELHGGTRHITDDTQTGKVSPIHTLDAAGAAVPLVLTPPVDGGWVTLPRSATLPYPLFKVEAGATYPITIIAQRNS